MHRKALTLVVCLLLVPAAAAREASAQVGQPWTERGYLNVNIGFETGSGTLIDATTFQRDLEDGTLAVESSVDSGSFFDFSVGSRVWRNVSAGIGFHRGSTSGEGAISASVPHPLIFNRHRQVATAVSGLDRTEQAFHLLLGYMLPLSEELSVHVSLGPSFFRLKQEVVSDAAFSDTVPITTVSVTPTITERTDSPVGFNIGVDGTYKVYETPTIKLGAGVFLRYAGASGKIQILNNVVDSDVGGLQIGFGGRLRF